MSGALIVPPEISLLIKGGKTTTMLTDNKKNLGNLKLVLLLE
jgi:hypothetical protein